MLFQLASKTHTKQFLSITIHAIPGTKRKQVAKFFKTMRTKLSLSHVAPLSSELPLPAAHGTMRLRRL
uniref:Uncharacterized protein n=1 Tax=Rhizophora mucronata TaxID=61149 RepID=A0A2P2KIL2_RHIMU